MARSYRPADRDQTFLLPPDLRDWLPADHLVWFILDVVAELDTSALHRRHPRGGVGRSAYDPDMLLGLLMYAYAVGERSSRRIERLCWEHIAFRVACGQDVPDHSTIARFRQANEAVFEDLFAQVLTLCARAGMGKLGSVAIDGTKIAANASRGANRSAEHLREQAKQILDEAARADAAEDRDDGGDDELPPPLRERGGRQARIKAALEELDRQQRAVDDADAAYASTVEDFLAAVENGHSPPGAPPTGVDPVRYHQARLNKWLKAEQEASTPRERAEARRHARRAQSALTTAQAASEESTLGHSGERPGARPVKAPNRLRPTEPRNINLTDPDSRLLACFGGGVIQGFNAQFAVSDDHLIVATAVTQCGTDYPAFEPMMSAAVAAADQISTATGNRCHVGLVLADAGYLSQSNLTATGPDRLIATGKNRDVEQAARERPVDHEPSPAPGSRDAMDHRLRTPEGLAAYRRRGATVEPVIGHLKDRIGLRRFSRRGLRAAAAELHLAAAMVNLTRLHNTRLATSC